MRKVAVGAVALLLAGCASTVEMRPVESWTARITADEPDDLRAAASVNAGVVETAASVSIAGAQSGATHPWHIHAGRCGSGGAIVGPASAYTPLSVGGNGQASSTARINVGLEPGGQYYINIHESPANLGTIIGCMQLSR